MKSQKGFSTPIIIFAGILVLLISGLFLFKQQKAPKTTPVTNESSNKEAVVLDETPEDSDPDPTLPSDPMRLEFPNLPDFIEWKNTRVEKDSETLYNAQIGVLNNEKGTYNDKHITGTLYTAEVPLNSVEDMNALINKFAEYYSEQENSNWKYLNKYEKYNLSSPSAGGALDGTLGYTLINNNSLKMYSLEVHPYAQSTDGVTYACPCSALFKVFHSDEVPVDSLIKE